MADGREEVRPRERTSNKYQAKQQARARIEAQRHQQARAERRRNVLVAGGATLVVLIVVGLLVGIGLMSKKKTSTAGNAVAAASSSVTDALTKAAGNSDASPDFSGVIPPKSITGSALTSGGKPEVLYIGAEYCPYCGATRWPLAVALSRFGTFGNLSTTYSSDTDTAGPHTPTLSFHKSTYSSAYVDFVSREQLDGAGKPLEKVSTAENKLFSTLTQGQESYPFIDFAGKWVQTGSAFDPKLLANMTPESVATAINDPASKQGKAIRAGADVFTAVICQADGGKPANVCTAAGAKAAATALKISQ